jgi:UDP-glucuronate decarboxylase
MVGPVNIGNPHEVTILDLAERIIALTGSNSGTEHRPLPVGDPTRRCPDISLARRELGWAPLIDLDEGLRRTIKAFELEMLAEAKLPQDGDSADGVPAERASAAPRERGV